MENDSTEILKNGFPQFDRKFFESTEDFTSIGKGSLGGKASGLAFIKKIIKEQIDSEKYPSIDINIPRMMVIRTDYFDKFMKRNNLYEIAYSDASDTRIVNAFLKADLPTEIVGDLRALIEKVNTPIAVRSSSLLEDAKFEPFAGIYETKMIPNNQASPDTRQHKLFEAIKYVYASTFFKAAKDYMKATNNSIQDEKMSVIIQEVVGHKYGERYYPNFSGVARSFNYYPTGKGKPEDGVIDLALGLGKTIVEGGVSWTYCPKYPKSVPPFADPEDMLKNTQTKFWTINMGPIKNYDPTKETEYLIQPALQDAEEDKSLKYIASTYDTESERIIMGIGKKGTRVLNFSQLLILNEFKFNDLIKHLLKVCEESLNNPVEIEFAATFDYIKSRMRFGFLQVRPMVVSSEIVEISDEEMEAVDVLISSNKVLGNGNIDNLIDVVYVKPEIFDKKNTEKIAEEVEEINNKLQDEKTKYVLIGFGRWGSSDPWLGIPVGWGQISNAKVIVESTLPEINVELSQGSHFFHNLTSFQVSYISVRYDDNNKIDWDWLNKQKVINDMKFVKHIKLKSPLRIKIDGRTGRGVIKK
ncbi:PEP/pyruvate-binding domain-containing protein [Bacteroidota bacterium]